MTRRVSYERFQDHPKVGTFAKTKVTKENVFKMMPKCWKIHQFPKCKIFETFITTKNLYRYHSEV